jgi:hypothetical protein
MNGRLKGGRHTILKVELDSGTIRRFAHPHVEIPPFSCFEEQDIIAVIQVGKLIQLKQLGFRVEFRFFATVRKKRV